MSESKARLGIALFHRASWLEILEETAGAVLAFLGVREGTPLGLYLDQEEMAQVGPGNLKEALRELRRGPLAKGGDRNVILASAGEEPTIYVQLYNPTQEQGRAVAPGLLGVVMAPESFSLDAFKALGTALELRYGYVTLERTFAAAYDEVFWPMTAKLRAPAEARRHTNAWIQLIRAFGRADVGVGVPDVYWGNLFGAGIINELRRHGCWDRLEQVCQLSYLENGVVLCSLSAAPEMLAGGSAVQAAAERLGDVLAPLGLMQRALQQARQGDHLLLTALVATRDQRLLMGLAYPDGLDAFRALVGGADAAEIGSVADALAYLEGSQGQRPRCYGEAWPVVPVAAEEGAPAEVAVVAAAVAAEEVEGGAEVPAVVGAEAVPVVAGAPAAPTLGGWSWIVRSIARGSVRLDLATVQWSAERAITEQRLEVGVQNALPRRLRLVGVTAVQMVQGEPAALVVADGLPLDLEAGSVRQLLTLDVPSPQGDDALVLQASVTYSLRESVADVMGGGGAMRVLGSPSSSSHVLSTWPADVRVSAQGERLLLQVTNTTQDPWQHWSLCLVGVGPSEECFDRFSGHGVLAPGATAYGWISGAAVPGKQPLQVRLEAEAACDTVLAVFEAS